MSAVEILVIIAVSIFVVSVFGITIYKRIKYKESSDCQECHAASKRTLKRIKKELQKDKKKSVQI